MDPLVTTDWLAAHLDDEKVRVVDIRGYVDKTDLGGGRQKAEYLAAREEYDEAHIPGAVYVDWTSDITNPDDPVLDARDEGQYPGAVVRGEAGAGRSPGAALLHAHGLRDPGSGTFHSD